MNWAGQKRVIEQMTSLKAVIFDFDGVLADSIPVYRAAVDETADDAGIDDADAGQIASADTWTVAQRIIKQYDLDVDVETMVRQIEDHALDRLLVTPCIVPGARELIVSIQQARLKTAVASLAPRRNIEAVLAQAEMQEFFDALVSIEDITKIKPDPEVFLQAADAVGVAGSECIAIEDSDRGITAALAAGMTAIALTTTLPADRLLHAHYITERLANLTLEKLRQIHLDVGKSSSQTRS
jgi:alpha,alpha-trehalose phosphorylase